MQRACLQCTAQFEIADTDLAFYETVSPVFNGKKELIPPPTLCPDCRQQRRWAFQNQHFLYRRTSQATGKEIISAYSPDKPLHVVERDIWLTMDNTEYGIPFDFSRPFFEQFSELFRKTAKANVLQSGEIINSEYTHGVGWQKNGYLVFDAGKCEDCLYITFVGYAKNCVDCTDMQRNEFCYDCVDLSDCNGLFHSTFCRNCHSSAYLFDCIGCKHCIGCANLRNKEYCVLNEEVGKERFLQTWAAMFSGSFAAQREWQKRCEEFLQRCPRRAVHNINASDSTGEYLVNCERVTDCYKCLELRDAKHCQYVVLKCNDLQDISSFGESLEFCYELAVSGGMVGKVGARNCCFNAYMFYGGNNVYYSIHCHDSCRDCFGCCDVRGKQYCILNKQYTKEEYETLVPKIIERMRSDGEYGEFFPIRLSLFAYNETPAQEYYPLKREDALARGYAWRDPAQKDYLPTTATLPDAIQDTPDTATKEILACAICAKNYRVVKQELEFYRAHHLPVPRLCFDCRHARRLKRRNPQKRWTRTCAKCGKGVLTSYAPERPEIVYCEQCYLETVY